MDVLSKEQRRKNMRKIKGKDTSIKTERIEQYGCSIKRRLPENFGRTEKRSSRACYGWTRTDKGRKDKRP